MDVLFFVILWSGPALIANAWARKEMIEALNRQFPSLDPNRYKNYGVEDFFFILLALAAGPMATIAAIIAAITFSREYRD